MQWFGGTGLLLQNIAPLAQVNNTQHPAAFRELDKCRQSVDFKLDGLGFFRYKY